jgi:hypothetical protein
MAFAMQVDERIACPYFSEEHELFRATIKRVCRDEIARYAKEWEARTLPAGPFKRAAGLGLFGFGSRGVGRRRMDCGQRRASMPALHDFPA